MSKGVRTCLPPHDGHPGVEITWAADCSEAFNQGAKLAQSWLDNARSGWLWAVMIAERDLLPCAIERRAFEVGFLGRIHQRICALNRRGNQPIRPLSLPL
ncbi:LasR-specific antiactivator QslA [Pseudomonas aeruginosa]